MVSMTGPLLMLQTNCNTMLATQGSALFRQTSLGAALSFVLGQPVQHWNLHKGAQNTRSSARTRLKLLHVARQAREGILFTFRLCGGRSGLALPRAHLPC